MQNLKRRNWNESNNCKHERPKQTVSWEKRGDERNVFDYSCLICKSFTCTNQNLRNRITGCVKCVPFRVKVRPRIIFRVFITFNERLVNMTFKREIKVAEETIFVSSKTYSDDLIFEKSNQVLLRNSRLMDGNPATNHTTPAIFFNA